MNVKTQEDLNAILDEISLADNAVHFFAELGWDIQPVEEQDMRTRVFLLRGFLLNLHYIRPDTWTGVVGVGKGRQEWIPLGASESAVVKTAWILLKLLGEHELMEAYAYKGARIFNPHHTVEDLTVAHAQWTGREKP